jgi:hypothetical protein
MRKRIYIRKRGSEYWAVFNTQEQVARAINIPYHSIISLALNKKLGSRSRITRKYEILYEEEYLAKYDPEG